MTAGGRARPPAGPGATRTPTAGASRSFPYQGPGELTLTAILLFTVGAYGVAAGAATGEQPIVAVGVFALTLFFVGVVWPIVALARLDVAVVAPTDATVGDMFEVQLRLRGRIGRVDVRVLDPAGPWRRTSVPASGRLAHTAVQRGVWRVLRVQMRTSAPLGVFIRTRTCRVELPVPLAVAPRPEPAAPVLRPVAATRTPAPLDGAVVAAGDVVRSVRPYVFGDPARLVHWPTSARRGELVVRELEPPPALGVALVVDLGGDAEVAASRAMGIGVATLGAGGLVWCCTHEPDGPVGALVVDARELGRRLARAIAGPPGEPPPGWATELVSAEVVSDKVVSAEVVSK